MAEKRPLNDPDGDRAAKRRRNRSMKSVEKRRSRLDMLRRALSEFGSRPVLNFKGLGHMSLASMAKIGRHAAELSQLAVMAPIRPGDSTEALRAIFTERFLTDVVGTALISKMIGCSSGDGQVRMTMVQTALKDCIARVFEQRRMGSQSGSLVLGLPSMPPMSEGSAVLITDGNADILNSIWGDLIAITSGRDMDFFQSAYDAVISLFVITKGYHPNKRGESHLYTPVIPKEEDKILLEISIKDVTDLFPGNVEGDESIRVLTRQVCYIAAQMINTQCQLEELSAKLAKSDENHAQARKARVVLSFDVKGDYRSTRYLSRQIITVKEHPVEMPSFDSRLTQISMMGEVGLLFMVPGTERYAHAMTVRAATLCRFFNESFRRRVRHSRLGEQPKEPYITAETVIQYMKALVQQKGMTRLDKDDLETIKPLYMVYKGHRAQIALMVRENSEMFALLKKEGRLGHLPGLFTPAEKPEDKPEETVSEEEPLVRKMTFSELLEHSKMALNRIYDASAKDLSEVVASELKLLKDLKEYKSNE